MRVRSRSGASAPLVCWPAWCDSGPRAAPLAIGPFAIDDDVRFAFTLTTPFKLERHGRKRGHGAGVGRARPRIARGRPCCGSPSTACRPMRLRSRYDVRDGRGWHEQRLALARAGERRRIRLRVRPSSADGSPAQVSLGNLGFGPGCHAVERVSPPSAARASRTSRGAPRRSFATTWLGVASTRTRTRCRGPFASRRAEPTASEAAALTRLGDGFDFRRRGAGPQSDDVGAVAGAAATDARDADAGHDHRSAPRRRAR